MSPTVEPVDFRTEWERALTALELDIDKAERLLESIRTGVSAELPRALGAWTPPAGLGPLPGSLADRAQLVLQRQFAVIEDIAGAAVRSRQHLQMQRRMRPTDATSRPMYVDAAF